MVLGVFVDNFTDVGAAVVSSHLLIWDCLS